MPRDGSTMGEVVLRGNTVMAGYLDDAAATAEAFRGGWLHSGDAAVVHPDGRIELRDRFKDVIISGGENISTIEVEQALARHPAVLDCAVVGIPDDHWGERPKAFVELRPGDGGHARRADGVLPRAAGAASSAPDSVEFGELPRTATGQGAEVRAARARVGGPRAPRQLSGSTECHAYRVRVAPEWGDGTAPLLALLCAGLAARGAGERRHGLRAARRDPARRAAARADDDASAGRLDARRRRACAASSCGRSRASGSRAATPPGTTRCTCSGVLQARPEPRAVQRRRADRAGRGPVRAAQPPALRARLGRLGAALGDRARGRARAAGRALPISRAAPFAPRPRDHDGELAAQALVEGDATEVQSRYVATLSARRPRERARAHARLDARRTRPTGRRPVSPARARLSRTRPGGSSCAPCARAAGSACSTARSATRRGRPRRCSTRRATWRAIRRRGRCACPPGLRLATTFGAEDLVALTGQDAARARAGWAGAWASAPRGLDLRLRRARRASRRRRADARPAARRRRSPFAGSSCAFALRARASVRALSCR